MGVYLVRNLHSSIPPYFGLKKEKNRKKKESWQDKRQKETAPPPPSLTQGLDPPLRREELTCYRLNLITGRQPVQVVEWD